MPNRIGCVSGRRAAMFAVGVSLALVLAWPAVRALTGFVSLTTLARPRWGVAPAWSLVEMALGRPGHWLRLWRWEAWSVARWWVLLGLLALALTPLRARRAEDGGRSPFAAMLVATALLAPWIALLELGYLVGVRLHSPTTVPEPSTIFVTQISWDTWLGEVWLWRGVVPTLAVGFIFFRYAAGFSRRAAAGAAAVLVPVAINWSLLWSRLWIVML